MIGQQWFTTTVKYEKTAEEGRITKIAESYLVDAISFTEAEAKIIKEMEPYISGEFITTTIKRSKISEIFPNGNGDKWYSSKVFFISLDEEKGVEKRIAATMFVQANDIKEAWDGINEGMKGTLADYEIFSITETNILEIFPAKTEPEA